MAESVIEYLNLTRICEFTRALHQLHQIGGDEVRAGPGNLHRTISGVSA
jgi:hypothetical protein